MMGSFNLGSIPLDGAEFVDMDGHFYTVALADILRAIADQVEEGATSGSAWAADGSEVTRWAVNS